MSDIVERLRQYRMYNPNRDSSHHPICDEAAARIEQLEAALRAWESAVRVDVLMEGPRYMGVSGGAGKRAWELTRAALEAKP